MRNNHSIRVLLVDDHHLVREGTKSILETEEDIEIVGEAVDGHDAVEKVRRLLPDVVTMDINLPKMNGIEATRIIHREFPKTRIIALSVYAERQVRESILEAGACEYIGKGEDPELLIEAIRAGCAESD